MSDVSVRIKTKDGTDIELDMAEARELYLTLSDLFGNVNTFPYVPYRPVEKPPWWEQPQMPPWAQGPSPFEIHYTGGTAKEDLNHDQK